MVSLNKLFVWTATCILFTPVHFVSATETKRVNQTAGNESSNQTATNLNSCPEILTKWIDDDFNQSKIYGLFETYPRKYAYTGSTCKVKLNTYLDETTDSATASNAAFKNAAEVGAFFKAHFRKRISQDYQARIANCFPVNTSRAFMAQTRFYSATNELEAANTAAIDELAFLDSVLIGSKSMLENIECPPVWPQQRGRCEKFRSTAASCWNTKNDRLEAMIDKTIELLQTKPNNKGIVDLNIEFQKCNTKKHIVKKQPSTTENECQPLLDKLNDKVSQVPWISGKKFQDLMGENQKSMRYGYLYPQFNTDRKKIKEALIGQLRFNRDAIAKFHKDNLEIFRCLAGDSVGPNCNFERVRSHLLNLPRLGPGFSKNDNIDKAKINYLNASTRYFQVNDCLLHKGEVRKQETDMALDMGKAALVSSIGGVTLGGAKLIGHLATSGRIAARLSQGWLLAGSSVNIGFTIDELNRSVATCREKLQSQSNISLSHVSLSNGSQSHLTAQVNDQATEANKNFNDELIRQTVCQGQHSAALLQAQKMEDDCLLEIVTASPDLLPLLTIAPAVKALIRSPLPAVGSDATVAVRAKNLKTRALAALEENPSKATGLPNASLISTVPEDFAKLEVQPWIQAQTTLQSYADTIAKGHPIETKYAIERFARLKIELSPNEIYQTLKNPLPSVIEQLTRLIEAEAVDFSTKKAAMEAISRFLKNNPDREFTMKSTKYLNLIYHNAHLPDSLRKMAYDELPISRFQAIPFMTSDEMRKKLVDKTQDLVADRIDTFDDTLQFPTQQTARQNHLFGLPSTSDSAANVRPPVQQFSAKKNYSNFRKLPPEQRKIKLDQLLLAPSSEGNLPNLNGLQQIGFIKTSTPAAGSSAVTYTLEYADLLAPSSSKISKIVIRVVEDGSSSKGLTNDEIQVIKKAVLNQENYTSAAFKDGLLTRLRTVKPETPGQE